MSANSPRSVSTGASTMRAGTRWSKKFAFTWQSPMRDHENHQCLRACEAGPSHNVLATDVGHWTLIGSQSYRTLDSNGIRMSLVGKSSTLSFKNTRAYTITV